MAGPLATARPGPGRSPRISGQGVAPTRVPGLVGFAACGLRRYKTMRAAVVVNPTKHHDGEQFRAEVCEAMAEQGWSEPLWLETTPEETGRGLAEAAVAEQVDVVLASGGDGTVTACAEGVAGSGVPLAVLPAGTGNLLARNLGLPLALDQALAVALDRPRPAARRGQRQRAPVRGHGRDRLRRDAAGQHQRAAEEAAGLGGLLALRAAPSAGPPGRGPRCAPTAAGCCAAGPAASSSATWARCRAGWPCCRARSPTTGCSISWC